MLDSILINRGLESQKTRVGVKALIALFIIALAVTMPEIAHVFFGNTAGIKWLPMYFPVLLGGLLLGARLGVVVGVLSPLCSYAFTLSFLGIPMPSLLRLPYMMFELGVFGLVSGLFSKAVIKHSYLSFASALTSIIVGRALFLLSVMIFSRSDVLTPSIVLSQLASGLPGAIIMLLGAPLITIVIKELMLKND